MRALVLGWLIAAVILYFLTQTILTIVGLDGWLTLPPLWDQASHALDAIHFSQAFRDLSPSKFLVQLHNSAMWPPVIPLLQAPFLMIFGENFGVVRSWVAWSAIPAVLSVFAVGVISHRRFGWLVGALGATLLAVSPYFLEFCLQEMMEVPGTFFFMLTLFFYIRYLNDGKARDWQLTCLSGIVLFFCKFNYAVMVMLPIMVCEFCYKPAFRAMIGQALGRFRRDVRWRSPFTIFVFAYIAFLVYVQKVGIHFEIGGQRVMIERALGNPTYFLIALLIIRNAIVNRPLLKDYIREIWTADEPIRSFLRFCVLPALVWLSYPAFFTTFFIFMFSEKTRQSSFWSMETLTYYPGAFLERYSAHPLIGILTLAALVVLLAFWKKLPRVSRFLVAITTFNFLLTITHPNYQARYLLTTVPILFLLLGLAIAHGLEALTKTSGTRFDKVWNALAPLAAILLFLAFPPSREELQKALISYTHPEKVNEVFAAICDEVKNAETNTIVGFSNYIAPASIALECYKRYPDMPREQMPTTMTRFGFHGETSGRRIVESMRIKQFFIVDYSQVGFDVGRLQETYLLDEAKTALDTTGSYRGKLVIDQGEAGYRVQVYTQDPGGEAQAQIQAQHPF